VAGHLLDLMGRAAHKCRHTSGTDRIRVYSLPQVMHRCANDVLMTKDALDEYRQKRWEISQSRTCMILKVSGLSVILSRREKRC
jgi:hypothetical protein